MAMRYAVGGKCAQAPAQRDGERRERDWDLAETSGEKKPIVTLKVAV